MKNSAQRWSWISNLIFRPATAAMGIAIAFAPAAVMTQSVQAQTYKVIYNFTGQRDGGHPTGNLAMDKAGNLYGAAYAFGQYGVGAIFRLQPKNSGWIFTPIYGFTAGADGAYPVGVTLGPDGGLYGTTYTGGDGAGCGVVYNLKPPPTRPAAFLTPWNETVLYTFNNSNDGCDPESGVTFDNAGNLYGTTPNGGAYDGGTVYQLTRNGSSWTEKTLHAFSGGSDGSYPSSPVVFDSAGNLYGAAAIRAVAAAAEGME